MHVRLTGKMRPSFNASALVVDIFASLSLTAITIIADNVIQAFTDVV